MDSDSGRCRRTDGKKWRCRKQVVPDNKYCEQHMHRGRQRSRKPVEVTETTSKSDTPITTFSNKTKQMIKSRDAVGTGTKFPIPGNQKFEVQKSPAIVASTKPSSANGKSKSNSNVFVTCTQAAINISHAVDTDKICETNSKYVDGNVLGFNLTEDKKNRNNNVGNNQSGSITPGFVFTLKSAPRNGTSRNNKSSRDHCSVAEVEPKRCRRTDGKKWRCSRDVVPQKKYCNSHMLRGRAKRHKVSSPSIIVDEASLVPVPKNDHINLNISIDSPDLTSDDDGDGISHFTSSSCSDATSHD